MTDRQLDRLPARLEVERLANFTRRGLSGRTIEAVLGHGIEMPEQLLFMSEADLKAIPGVGKAALKEIAAYRARFLPEAEKP
jgi:DNA-directed RNA polymerase alpha subunit